jgi:hypothetical protein
VRERESDGGGDVFTMGADFMLIKVVAEEGCSKDGARARGGEWTGVRTVRMSGYKRDPSTPGRAGAAERER